MIDVKDEILNGEPMYRITDKDGNILFDNIRIEMTTPVIQEGTPLNKVLFDSIKESIKSIIPDSYVIGTCNSDGSAMTINCGFKPKMIILIIQKAKYGGMYSAAIIDNKGVYTESDGNTELFSVTLSDTGCSFSTSVRPENIYSYIAFKGI